MSLETVKCQQCGSADVTEFKPRTYVCSHCEAIFTQISRMLDPAPARLMNAACWLLAGALTAAAHLRHASRSSLWGQAR